MTGRLIAIEGIDGAGTTTQAHLLVDWLNGAGHRAHFTCEPSTGPVGRLLREILQHRTEHPVDAAAVALLFAADRVDHVRHEVAPRLAQGVHVVTDRYVYSSLAYQSLDQDPAWVAEINRLAPEPDLTLYVRTPPEVARARREARGSGQELFEIHELQQRISAQYDAIFGSTPDRGSWVPDPTRSDWIQVDPRPGSGFHGRRPVTAILDGCLPVAELHQQLRGLVARVALGGVTT